MNNVFRDNGGIPQNFRNNPCVYLKPDHVRKGSVAIEYTGMQEMAP